MNDKGIWLSAVEPVLDSNNEVIGMVEVDENGKTYFTKVKKMFISELLFIFTGIVIIAFIMLPVVRKILREEQEEMDEITEQRDTVKEYSNEMQASVRCASALQ